MAMPSPLFFQPSTPTSSRHGLTSYPHLPVNPSPLASSPFSSKSSPVHAAQSRRRDQYKQIASSPSNARNRLSHGRGTPSSSRHALPAAEGDTLEAPRKAVLRERFKARCIERAQKDRARRVSGQRALSSEASSDGLAADMEYEEEAEDEEFLNDELFSRIMKSVNRKQKHQYNLSYQYDVGSSFDPELEDVAAWENDLKVSPPLSTEPDDLDEEELAVYAEEYQILQEFQDLPVDDIFGLSDLEDIPEEEPFDWKGKGGGQQVSQDMDMD